MKLLRKDTLTRKVEGLERIIDFLRSRTDNEATTVLARLRLGDRVEDVAMSLAQVPSPAASSFRPPMYVLSFTGPLPVGLISDHQVSLRSNESAESSKSGGTSHHSLSTFSDGELHSAYRRDHTASPTLFLEPRRSSTSAVQNKGKSPALVEGSDETSFLTPLFDRQDFLLSTVESDYEDEPDVDEEANVDIKMLRRVPSIDAGASPASSMGTSRSVTTSTLRVDDTTQSAYATQLRHRQPIVNTILLHPNLNLRNQFGNLSFSSSIRANNYPPNIQDIQIDNLSLPTWSMMTINTRPDPGSLRHAFAPILKEATESIQAGTPVELVIEAHPNIAALFDPKEYERSGMLSRWAAGMVHGVQRKGGLLMQASHALC